MEPVGKRIKRLRTERGLSQRQVADAIGIKQPSLGDIETGESKNPAALTLIKLAKLFAIDPEHLLTGKGPHQAVNALSQDESELLQLFRALSEAGRAYVLSRARAIREDEYRHRPQAGDGDAEVDTVKPNSH